MTTAHEQSTLHQLVVETLDGDVLELKARHVSIDEQPDEPRCVVRIELHPTGGDAPRTIEGVGVGVVDAVFHAVRDSLANTYPSLSHIFFEDFRVTGDMHTRRGAEGTDAAGTAQLVVRNEEGRHFTFSETSRSITTAVVRVVLDALSHFVNAERAVRSMVKAVEDARSRNRGELVEAYTMKLSELVKHASYADVVKDAQQKASYE